MNTDEVFENVTVIKSKRKTVELSVSTDGSLILRAPTRMTSEQMRQFVESRLPWIEKQLKKCETARAKAAAQPLTKEEITELCEKARAVLPGRVHYYAELLNVSYGKITVRCQKTRWGSCNKNGDLSFNCLLMLLPDEIVDSVVLHELCHRRHMDHSQRFYAEMRSVMPDYKKRDSWLKKNGGAVILRAHGTKGI